MNVSTIEIRNVSHLHGSTHLGNIHALFEESGEWMLVGTVKIDGVIMPEFMLKDGMSQARIKEVTIFDPFDRNPSIISFKADLIIGHEWTTSYIKGRLNDLLNQSDKPLVIKSQRESQALLHATQLMNCFDRMTLAEIKNKIKIIVDKLNEK